LIDTHCHILPNLDDGPVTLEEALDIARIASNDGIKAIIATPHYKLGVYQNSSQTIILAVNQLNNRLIEDGIPVKVFPGMEIHFYPELIDDLENGEVLTLNNSPYLLIEFPNDIHLSSYIEQYLFQLQLNGYIPIIAHIERCFDFSRNIKLLEKWHNRGIESQLTSASLNGIFGKKIQLFAQQTLKKGLIDYLVTDAHSVSKFGRKPILSEGMNKISRMIGKEKALELVTTNPARILTSNRIEKEDREIFVPDNHQDKSND
jgi:protein-tyrosine phosphatase